MTSYLIFLLSCAGCTFSFLYADRFVERFTPRRQFAGYSLFLLIFTFFLATGFLSGLALLGVSL